MAKKKFFKGVRDSKTGEFVKKSKAKSNPGSTQTESIPKKGHGVTGRGKKKSGRKKKR